MLLSLFAVALLTHLTIFFHNTLTDTPARPRKFIFSLLLFGFCMTRIAALSLRVAWARTPFNANVAIAAGVLTNAGVLILFIVNVILGIRVLKGCLPQIGWRKEVYWGLRGIIGTVVGVLVMVVVCNVHSLFTLDAHTRQMEREVLLFAGVYMSVLAFLPAAGMAVLFVVMESNGGERWKRAENFGTGKMTTKMGMLLGASLLLTLGAGFRCGVSFAARPLANPGWWHGKAPFYVFSFALDLVVVYMYAIMRFDRRFCVPPNCKGPGDYSRVTVQEEDGGEGGKKDGARDASPPGASVEKKRSVGDGDSMA